MRLAGVPDKHGSVRNCKTRFDSSARHLKSHELKSMMRAILTALRRFFFGQHAVGKPTAKPRALEIVSCTVGHSATSADRSEGRITMNAAYEKLCEHLTSQN